MFLIFSWDSKQRSPMFPVSNM